MNLNQLCCGAALCSLVLGFSACTKTELKKDEDFNKVLVINELVASNQTGLLTVKGKTSDWLEIKNVSNEEVSLKGFSLIYERAAVPSKTPKKEEKAQKKQEEKSDTPEDVGPWEFPDVTIKPGECVVVFASGKTKHNSEKEMHTNFKLASEGGKVQLVGDDDMVMAEVEYGALNPDEGFCRQANGGYEKSYYLTPGANNDKAGYEAYNQLIDSQRKSDLLIWRVFTKGGTENWAEVKNVSSAPIDLAQYSLTDNPSKPEKWKFPAVKLAPGETYKVEFVGKKAPANDPVKVCFKVDEQVVILNKGGKFADGVNATLSKQGSTMGRTEGKKGFFFFSSTGAEEGSRPFRFIAKAPTFSHTPGVYGKQKEMSITLKADGTVRYTTTGALPSSNSSISKEPVHISKSTTFRAYTEGDSATLSSPVVTSTFILGQPHDVAVMNITVDHGDLYNYSNGIYVEGPGYDEEIPHKGANYWKNWEKRAHIEMFDGKEGFSEGCVLKIFGGFSRMLPKKSFRIKFNGTHGPSSLLYDYFGDGEPEELKTFVLRAGGQDASNLMGRDEFFTSLLAEYNPSALVQDYRPVALYVNAEYFGLYFIREKINNDFVARHLGGSKDSVEMIGSIYYQHNQDNAYHVLETYARSHNMKNEQEYQHVAQNIHLENYIDYKIAEIYAYNTDIGNLRACRSTDAESDKKWRWIFYDLDASFLDKCTAGYYLGVNNSSPHVNSHNRLVNALLVNPEFRDLFLQRLSYHLQNTFAPQNATKVFDKLMKSIDSEMVLNCKRWKNIIIYDSWKKGVTHFRARLQTRHKEVLADLRSYLRITKDEEKKYFSELGY
ncbi:MAG: CotH kinase family protein [Sodaliphilus sp.]